MAEAVVQVPPRRGRKPKNYKKYERRIVGFVLGSITEKRKADESCGYVSWVAVAEDFQRWVLVSIALVLCVGFGLGGTSVK